MGGCIDETGLNDDLVEPYHELVDLDRLCPAFGCDDVENPACLSDDVSETLTNNGGMAQGAKLAIFDVFYGNYGLVEHIGNGLWEPCVEAGCKLHSNSWGADEGCETTPMDLLYDAFMYEVRGVMWGSVPWFGNWDEVSRTPVACMAAPSYHKYARATAASVRRRFFVFFASRLCAQSSCAHMRVKPIVDEGAKKDTCWI